MKTEALATGTQYTVIVNGTVLQSGIALERDAITLADNYLQDNPTAVVFYAQGMVKVDALAPPVDTTKPSVPGGLTATATSATKVSLAWVVSTTANTQHALAGYDVYRNGAKVGTSPTNSYADAGLTAATAYTYTVDAYDDAGNTSSQSVSAAATTQAVAPPPPPTVITDKAQHPMTPVAQPAKGQSYVDPQFGRTIQRLTDSGVGNFTVPSYSTTQPFNADETSLILYRHDSTGTYHDLYQLQNGTFTFVRPLPISTADVEQFYWSSTDPDVLYYPSTNWSFIKLQVSTGVKTVLHQYPLTGSYELADSHCEMSWDNKVIGIGQQSSNTAMIYHLAVDANGTPIVDASAGGTGVATFNTMPMPTGVTRGPDVAPSGQLAYYVGFVYDGQFNLLRSLSVNDGPNDQNAREHSCLGRLADGSDTYNTVSFNSYLGNPTYNLPPLPNNIGNLIVHNMNTGASKVVIGPSTGYGTFPNTGTHISSLCTQKPGWIAMSSIGQPTGINLLDNELYLVNTNPGHDSVVYRLCHTRSYASAYQPNNTPWQTNPGMSYWGEPHPDISPKGTFIVYASDWGGQNQVDTYITRIDDITAVG